MGRKNCKTSGGVLLGLDVQWEGPLSLLLLGSMFCGFKDNWSKLQSAQG